MASCWSGKERWKVVVWLRAVSSFFLLQLLPLFPPLYCLPLYRATPLLCVCVLLGCFALLWQLSIDTTGGGDVGVAAKFPPSHHIDHPTTSPPHDSRLYPKPCSSIGGMGNGDASDASSISRTDCTTLRDQNSVVSVQHSRHGPRMTQNSFLFSFLLLVRFSPSHLVCVLDTLEFF